MHWSPDRTLVRVWAPFVDRLDVAFDDRTVPLDHAGRGWFEGHIDGVEPGDRYRLVLDGEAERPDPASLSQPDGVHGPSEVVDLAFDWSDAGWRNPPLHEHVVYELHVGTFGTSGDFDGVVERLPHLVDLGITAVELMPVAQFPGERNWGYDGVDLYAVHQSYGGPRGLQRLVDACHRRGLAVFLDVVYNHLGPEGNYLREFGRYFTDRHHTPWGDAVNLDGPGSDHVRRFFVDNALMWIEDFHVDGLRLDAVHALFDQSARPFLAQLADEVGARAADLGRRVDLIAENAANDPRLVRDRSEGGYAFDAAWNDDFHHALHVALTGEDVHYYADFQDAVPDLTTALADGYVNAGRFSPYRDRCHGAPSDDLPRSRLVVFAQNHDQVGNRAHGERLSTLVDPDRLRFAAGATLASPWVPMLFMGEEWGEERPFLYFVDHGDPDLLEAVRRGRAAEFSGFFDAATGSLPDPADPATFEASRLDWESSSVRREMLDLHAELIRVRSECPAIGHPDPDAHRVDRAGTVIGVESTADDHRVLAVFNAGDDPVSATLPAGSWNLLVDGTAPRFGGSGGARVAGDTADLPGWGFLLLVEREAS